MLLKTGILRSPSFWYLDGDVDSDIDSDRDLFSFSGVNQFPKAAITNYYKLGVLNNKNGFPHSFGGHKSKIKVLAELVLSRGSQEKSVPCFSPSHPWQQCLA